MPSAVAATVTFLKTVGLAVGGLSISAGTALAIGAATVVAGAVAASKLIAELYKVPSIDGERSRQATVRGTVEPQKLIYGEALVSGPISFVGVAGTDNRDLYHAIVLSGHPSDSISDIYFDDERIASGHINAAGNVTTGTFGPKDGTTICVIRKLTGNQTTADSVLDGAFATINSSEHIGTNLTYIVTKFTLTEDSQETWDKFMPNDIKALVKGKKVYDPRQDSTSDYYDATVGVATQRASDSSTWKWSENPVWCLVDYLTDDRFGMGIDLDRIDLSKATDAADVCDATVSVPGGSEKRYTCNGVVFGTATHKTNINKILSSMNGMLTYTNGKYVIRAGAFEAVGTGMTLTEDNMIGPVRLKTSFERNERFNTITGTFIDPSKNYKEIEFPKVQITSALTRDNNEELIQELKLSMTNSRYMAQRIAHKLIQLSDLQKVLTFPTNLAGVNISVGDRINVTLSEFGYTNKTFVCLGWTLSDSGTGGVNLTLREDDSSSYADLGSGGYSTVTPAGGIQQGFFGVPDPSGLSATAHVESIELDWTNPANMTGIIAIEVFASPNSSWSSAVKIGETIGTQFIHDESNGADSISEGDQRYYWVRARRFPAGEGADAVSDRNPDSDTSTVQATKGALGALSGLDTVGDSQIDDNAVTNRTIDDGAVDTTELADEAVTIDKIDSTLESTNYVAGTSGWRLTTAGDFEAGDGLFRGDIQATVLDVENANVHGTLTATNIAAGIVTADTLAADVFAEFDDRYGGSGGFYRADNDEFFDGSATKLVPLATVTHDNAKPIRFQCNLVHAWGTTQGYGGTNGLKLRVTFEYSTDNTTWAKVPGSGENSQDYYERSATVTTYTVTSGFDIAADIRYEMTGSSLSDNTAYYFRVKIEYVSATNAFTSSTLGSANGVPIKFNVQQTAGLTAAAGDADTVDGLQASQFLRSDVDDTFDGDLTITGDLKLGDTDEIRFGDDEDLKISHSGGGGDIENDTGNLTIKNRAVDGDIYFMSDDGTGYGTDTYMMLDGGEKKVKFLEEVVISDDLTVTGNLTITGNIDQYNVTDLDVTDKTITVNSDGTQALSDGAGLIVDRGTAADASITWNESGDKFDFTHPISVSGIMSGGFDVANFYSGSTQAHLNIGRSSAQRFNFYVTDGPGYIRYYQDETDGTDHSVHFQIQSSSSGTNQFYFNKQVNVTGHGNSSQWNTAYTYSQVGHLPLSGGTITGNLTRQSATTGTAFIRIDNTATGTNNYAALQFNSDYNHTYNPGLFLNSNTNTNYAGANSLNLWQYHNLPVGIVTNNQLRMTVLGDGNVSIGSTDSHEKLYVNGSIRADGAYKVGGLTVISSSRQLQNIASYEGGAVDITTAGQTLTVRGGNVSNGTTNKQIIFGYASTTQYAQNIRTRHNSGTGTGNAIDFYLWDQANDASTDHGSMRALKIETGKGVDLVMPSGNYQIGGSTVIASTRRFYASNGTVAKAAFSFDGESNTGMYKYGTNQIGFTAGGSLIAYIQSGATYGLVVQSKISATGGNSDNWNTAYTYSQVGHLPLAGGTLTGRVTFPTGSTTKPILEEGFFARTTSDTTGTHDIWGISGQFNPSASLAADQWGIQWSGSPNEINFIGAGQKKLSIDLDTAGDVEIDGNRIWDAGDFSSTNITNWNTAYGWGDHSAAGYLQTNDNITVGTISSGVITSSGTSTFDAIEIDDNYGVRFGHANQVDQNDGRISAGRHGSGLNIVGVQTASSTGRQVRVWGALIDDAGHNYIRDGVTNSSNLTITGAMQANNGYKIGSTTIINSSRNLINVAGMTTEASSSNLVDLSPTVNGQILHRLWNKSTGGSAHAVMRIANSGNTNQGTRLEFSDQTYYVGTVSADRTNGMEFYVGNMTNPLQSMRMQISTGGNVAIGTGVESGFGKLHIKDSDSGATPYQSGNGGLTIERNGRVAINLLTPNTQDAYVFFGDPQTANAGFVGYEHSTDLLVIKSQGYVKTQGSGLNISGGNLQMGGVGVIDGSRNIAAATISSGAITSSGNVEAPTLTGTSVIQADRLGTATSSSNQFNSADIRLYASGWDTNNSLARTVGWKIRNIPTASNYPDHDLHFIEDDQGTQYTKFSLHGRGSVNHTDPRAGTFFGNLHVEAGSGTNAGNGDITSSGVLTINSTGSSNAIVAKTGSLINFQVETYATQTTLRTDSTDFYIWQPNSGYQFRATNNGAVYLSYDGSTRLTTSSAGVSVTGTISSGAITSSAGLTFSTKDAGIITFGSSGANPGWSAPKIWREDSHLALSDYSGVKLGGYNGTAYGPRFHVNGNGNVDILEGDLRMGTTTVIASTRRLYASNGTVTKAAFSFDGESNTGMYKYGTNQIGFTAGGNLMAYIQSGSTYGLVVQSKISATGGNSDNWNAGYTYSTVGHLPLAGGTMSARINFFTSNVQAPTSTDATTGARLNLYSNGSGRDYTIGIESGNMWFNTDGGFKWYQDGAARMQMESGGDFNLSTGSLKTNGVTRIANNGNATLGTISSGAISTSANFLMTGGFSIYLGTTSRLSSDNNGSFGINYGTTGGASLNSLVVYNNTTPSVTLYRSGNIQTTNGLGFYNYTSDARMHLGNNGGGAAGIFAGRRLGDGTSLKYGTYWAYDAFWDDDTRKWSSVRTTLGQKRQIEMNYHTGGWHFKYINPTTTQHSNGWADSDWETAVYFSNNGKIDANDTIDARLGFIVNGNTVIDANRNLVGIGTINTTGKATIDNAVVADTLHIRGDANTAYTESNMVGGISLWGPAGQSTSQIMFKQNNQGSPALGNHGFLNDQYATYFVMDTNGRGWVFRNATTNTNVASISTTGGAAFDGGIKIGTSTVIDSSRVVQNVTLKAGGLGSRFEHNNWHQSADGYNRFYFASASHTYFRTGSAYVFRDNGDTGRATISAYGGANLLSGGDGHVASNVALAVGGTTVIDSARHATFAKVFSDNLSTTADRIGAIKIARLHPTSGTSPVTDIDNLETFILSKTDGGYGPGTKPSGGDNATGIISLQTHTGGYYTQLALQTNGNNLWIRSAHASSSYGSWEKLVKENANTTLGTTTTGALTATNISATSLTLSGTFSPTGISATGDIAGGQFRASYGSESAPAYTFKNDDDTGMYGSANRIHFAVSGDEKIQVQPSSIILFESTTIQDELKVGTIPQTVIDTGRQLQNVTVSQGEAEYGQSLNGNFGQWLAHSRYATSPGFNQDVDFWGWNFVQGNINAPHTGSSQWYRNRISLGNQYGHGISSGDYWLEIAHPRTTGITGQMYIRACESGSIGQWREVGSAIRGDQQVAGRVGIGTSPESGFGRLHIKDSDSGATPYQTANGGITVERNGRTAINLLSPNTSSGYLFFADPQSAVAGYIGYDHSATQIEIKSEGYVKTYGSGLDVTGGNVLIAGQEVISGARNITAVAGGFSGLLSNSAGAKLEIQNGTDGGNSRGIFMWSTADTNWGIYMSTAGSGKSLSGGSASSGLDGRTSHGIRFRVANSSTQIGFLFENGSEQALAQITADSGNFLAKGNVTAYASDERLKTNIKPIQRPLEKLMKLRGVEFDWIDGIEKTHGFIPKCKHETGVIAQQVEQVIPDAISPAPFNNEYKTVEHTKIISLLIESVRSQQETIESLTKRIEELENGDN